MTLTLKVSLAALLLAATAASADVRQLALPSNDLGYDPATHRIYASVPSRAGAAALCTTMVPRAARRATRTAAEPRSSSSARSRPGCMLTTATALTPSFTGQSRTQAVWRFRIRSQTCSPAPVRAFGSTRGPRTAGSSAAAPFGLVFQTDRGQLVLIRRAEPAPPPPPPSLLTRRVSPAAVRGDTTVTGAVTLSAPAPAGGVQVLLSSLDSRVSLPPAVTVPDGAATATFPITVHAPPAGTAVLLTAQLGGVVRTAHLTIRPADHPAGG